MRRTGVLVALSGYQPSGRGIASRGNCKRMLFRNASGAVRERQLFRVETDPREQEFEIGDKQPAKANELQK